MKFSVYSTLLLAGAGFASATSSDNNAGRKAVPNVRLGHALASAIPAPQPGHFERIAFVDKVEAGKVHGKKMPCGGVRGSKFRANALSMVNAVRKAFGLKPVKTVTITIIPPHGGKMIPPSGEHTEGRPHHHHSPQDMSHHVEGVPNHRFRHHHHHHKSFNARLQRALMSLGPWEGGAVAFVFGCGIGVLLRMFFVLAIVLVRGIRGSRSEEVEGYTRLDAEELVVAPPEYTDEKVEAVAKV